MTKIPPLSFTGALRVSTSRTLQFKGRSRRSEYWWTMLVVMIIGHFIWQAFLLLLIATIPLTVRRLHDIGRSGWWCLGFLLQILFIPVFAFDLMLIWTHPDYNPAMITQLLFSFKYIIIFFAMLIYNTVMLIFLCRDSQPYINEYGESPKYPETEADIHTDAF